MCVYVSVCVSVLTFISVVNTDHLKCSFHVESRDREKEGESEGVYVANIQQSYSNADQSHENLICSSYFSLLFSLQRFHQFTNTLPCVCLLQAQLLLKGPLDGVYVHLHASMCAGVLSK